MMRLVHAGIAPQAEVVVLLGVRQLRELADGIEDGQRVVPLRTELVEQVYATNLGRGAGRIPRRQDEAPLSWQQLPFRFLFRPPT